MRRIIVMMDDLKIMQHVPLKGYSTMRLGGPAAYAVEVANRLQLTAALDWAKEQNLPVIMIGTGSNTFWRDEGFPGLLIINKIMRREVFNEDGENVYLNIGAGENWDEVVAYSVSLGLTGIECLSLIPGTAGATPVQNVGAYGQEISQSLVTVEAYDTQTNQFLNLRPSDCGFGYRTSIFKTSERGRYFITGISLHLIKGNPQPPFYNALQRYLDEHNITEWTPQIIRNAIIDIRSSKLPDPATVANNGSFFGNPIVDELEFTQLQSKYPDMPHWPTDDGRIKIPAAWLIEQCGYSNYHDAVTGMATWSKQSLVLVNEHAKSTSDLIKFKTAIIDAVRAKFDITLQQEPELLP